MDITRRRVLRDGTAIGAVAWAAPAVTGVHVARAQPSPIVSGHAISFVGIIYRTLGDGPSGATLHLMKAEFGPKGPADTDEGEVLILDGRWLVETRQPKLPSCAPPADPSTYGDGDPSVVDPAGPRAGADPPAAFADELDADGEPQRVILGIAAGHELVSVFVKCGTECVGILAEDLDRTFDGKYLVESCAYYLAPPG